MTRFGRLAASLWLGTFVSSGQTLQGPGNVPCPSSTTYLPPSEILTSIQPKINFSLAPASLSPLGKIQGVEAFRIASSSTVLLVYEDENVRQQQLGSFVRLGAVKWIPGRYAQGQLWIVDWNIVRDLKFVLLQFSQESDHPTLSLRAAYLYAPPECFWNAGESGDAPSSEIGELQYAAGTRLPEDPLVSRVTAALTDQITAKRRQRGLNRSLAGPRYKRRR